MGGAWIAGFLEGGIWACWMESRAQHLGMSVAGWAEETAAAKAREETQPAEGRCWEVGRVHRGSCRGRRGPVERGLVYEAREFAPCPGREGGRSRIAADLPLHKKPWAAGKTPQRRGGLAVSNGSWEWRPSAGGGHGRG